MRATLDIDTDILKAAKVLAEAERKTLGQALSDLVRKGLADVAGAPPLTGEPRSLRRRPGARLTGPGGGCGKAQGAEEVSHANDARH